jgi:hypothetical protein
LPTAAMWPHTRGRVTAKSQKTGQCVPET